MKEMRAFNKATEGFPWPAPAAPLVFKEHMLIFQDNLETVFKSRCLAIYDLWENIPEHDHHAEP